MIKQRATAKFSGQRKLTRALSTDKSIEIEKITDIDDYEKLKNLLQLINMTLKSGQKFNVTAYNRLGESIMFLALQRDIEKLKNLNHEQIKKYQIEWNGGEDEHSLQIDPEAKKKLQSELSFIVGVVCGLCLNCCYCFFSAFVVKIRFSPFSTLLSFYP